MMKIFRLKSVLAILSIVVSTTAAAQWKEYEPQRYKLFGEIDYPLSDYLNPEYHYRELMATFHLSGSYKNSIAKNSEKTTENSMNFSPDAGLTAYSLHNTARLQQTTSWRAFAGMAVNSLNSGSDRIDKQIQAFDAGLSGYYRTEALIYSGKRFFGLGGFGQVNYSSQHSENEVSGITPQLQTSDRRDFAATIAPRLLIGWGRVEQTSNAWQAVQLVRSLQRADRLATVPSGEVITQLADQVTLLRNRRTLDSRLKTIADLVQLDSTLVALGLVTKSDVVCFAAVNDIYNFAPRPNRPSGNKYYAGFETSASYYHRYSGIKQVNIAAVDVDEETTTEYNAQKYRFIAGLLLAKPINLEWQRTIAVEFGAGIGNNNNTAEMRTLFAPGAFLQSSIDYSFFPNTRTTLSFGASGEFDWWSVQYDVPELISNNGAEITSDMIDANLSVDASYNYYLSPALSLNIQAQIVYTLLQIDRSSDAGFVGLQPGLQYNKGINFNVWGALVYQIW